ncbi:LysR family transcriptional regulator [Methylobacterium haplocladii]|uniref:Transcriptional regulator n=2 Tax=Methylobacterium haplocladii TaxID=1176176 RepID=A0A512IQF6_9HYPH|nr:LysR family transcriptional regulator [Methylobacterium haplocladii]GEO99910.1 transcriptional regulator [Methylobacterium haplocladii]GJD82731.1 HTH-type transcriptional regulator DmlR [Methylobacterium haplocladii]GLS58074.1 transcriptional regulator [Methylobacterium haplocladii]
MMQELQELGGLDELAALVAVAEAGSFIAAAKVLGRDASVLSRRVSQLEERLGVRLLSRTTRRVALTEVGSAYCRRVQALLDELASANREATDNAASPQGLVRVSVPVSFGRAWIAPLLPAFLARHPQIRLDLRLTDRFVDVVAEGFDVSIRVAAGEQRDSSLTTRRIASYRNLLVASPGYLSAHGTPRAPDDLMQHACLGFTGYAAWPDWPLTKDGKRHTVRPNCTLVADHSEVLLTAAVEGAGITFTADWLAGPALRAGRLIEVLPGWGGKKSGGVYAILPPGRLVPAKTRLFVDEVAQAIKAGWAR